MICALDKVIQNSIERDTQETALHSWLEGWQSAPLELRRMSIWMLSRYDKTEHRYADLGTRPKRCPVTDKGRLCALDEALVDLAQLTGQFVSLVPWAESRIVVLDIDNCVIDGVVQASVLDLIRGSWATLSASGTGVHAVFRGLMSNVAARPGRAGAPAVEVFSGGGGPELGKQIMMTFRPVPGHKN